MSNLDAKLRVSMRTEIKNLHHRLRTTTVYVTHDQIEAMTMADKIVVMNGGRVEQAGPPLEIYDRPENVFVAGFIGSPAMNMVAGRANGEAFVTHAGARLPLNGSAPRDRDLVYGFRPEAMALGGDVALRVEVVEPTGSETHVVALLGETEVTCVFRERIAARPGDEIRVSIDPHAVHLFDEQGGQRLSA